MSDQNAETLAAPSDDLPRGFGRKQLVGLVVTVVALVVVFAAVLPQLGDYGQAWAAIQEMSTAALIVLLLATTGVVLVYVPPFQAALPGLAFGPAFVVRQTAFMIGNAVPAGGALGLGVQYTMLNRYGIAPSSATAAIGISSLWNTLVTLALPALALVLLAFRGETDGPAALLAVVGVVLVASMIAALTLILRRESTARRLGGWADRLIAGLARLGGREIDTDLGSALVEFRGAIVGVVVQRWLAITLTNTGQQLAQFAVLWVALVAVTGTSASPTLIEAFAAFSIARLLSFVPVTPGGIGTVDAALTAILQAFGAGADEALAATLLWRAATYFPQILIGMGTFLVWRRRTA